MSKVLEIRWHGRGGQGAKTACLLQLMISLVYENLPLNNWRKAKIKTMKLFYFKIRNKRYFFNS